VLFFWRSRAQSEVDLVVKQNDRLRAFQIKWSGRRTASRAFRDAYGINRPLDRRTPSRPTSWRYDHVKPRIGYGPLEEDKARIRSCPGT